MSSQSTSRFIARSLIRSRQLRSARANLPSPRAFGSSGRKCQAETAEQKTQRENHEERKRQQRKEESRRREEEAGPPPGVTPWTRFVEVLKAEFQKSQEMQQATKELSGRAEGFKDSEAMQRAKQMYTAMHLQNLINENPRLAAMASQISKTGRSVSDIVDRTAKEIEDSRLMTAAREAAARVDKAMEPIRQTDAYKAVEDTVDFSEGALRYGGYIEKAERDRKRQKRLERLGRAERGMGVLGGPGSKAHREAAEKASGVDQADVGGASTGSTAASAEGDQPEHLEQSSHGIAANPDAAPALVLHATANKTPDERPSQFARLAPDSVRKALANMSAAYQESDNPVIATMRGVTGAVGRFFDETETAKVTRWVKEMDPEFDMNAFVRDLREYVVPEIVDAYVQADLKTLKLWTSEGAYNVITAPMQLYLQRGLRPESQVVDLRGIEIMTAKILEERDLPVFVVAFRTHEITAFVNPRTREVEGGSLDQIDKVQYVMVMTREAETCGDERTGGWRVIDMARRGQAAFL